MEQYVYPLLSPLEPVLIALANRSLTALWLVAAVIVLRLALRRAPKSLHCVLWALVAIRLIVPLSIQSPFSAYQASSHVAEESGEVEYVRYVGEDEKPLASVAVPVPAPATTREASEPAVQESRTVYLPPLVELWLLGMAAMLGYALVSDLRLRRRVAASLPLDGVTRLCDEIDTPFILGVLRPRIYLPSGLDETQREMVLAHERAHLARRDHFWKPFGFALLSVYWFNPGLWLAYILLCRDIELACDERVLRELGSGAKKPYSEALLACSVPRRMVSACPVAFGEVGVKERVRAALHYKKPAFWIVAVAVIACAAAAVCFLTDPKTKEDQPMTQELAAGYTLERAKADGSLVMENGTVTAGKQAFRDFLTEGPGASLRIVHYYTMDDPSGYGEEYYAEHKDEYPALYVHELSYDGIAYTWRGWEDGGEYVRQYPYLLRFAGNDRPFGDPLYYVRYVLVNDPTVTWEKIVSGMLSSQSGDWIDHEVVYQERPDESPLAALTLDDVRALAQRGEALSARDFDGYEYFVTGSGLYIKVYPIDNVFSVALGLSGPDRDEPMYYCNLWARTGGETERDSIDIRTDDVEAFIAAHSAGADEQSQAGADFAGIMGFDGHIASDFSSGGIGAHHAANRYYADIGGDLRLIAESFGFERDDHATDLDGDGISELICNCVYGADGAQRVFVYRRNGNAIERGTPDYDKLNLTAWDNWGANSTAERFDPASGTILLEYASLASSSGDGTAPGTFVREIGWDELAWEPYAVLDGTGEPTARIETAPAVHASAPPTVDAPAAEQPAEAAEAPSEERLPALADEPENTMVVVIDLSNYEGGEGL